MQQRMQQRKALKAMPAVRAHFTFTFTFIPILTPGHASGEPSVRRSRRALTLTLILTT